ncbi:MAG TPA: ATP-binding protein [Burkholderiaceae bacterium]|nr:ATP-binding protein [Burkholderiaceae bacterium]
MASPASSQAVRRPAPRPLWWSRRPAAPPPPTSQLGDSSLDLGPAAGQGRAGAAWIGWRLRLLVVAALLGCLGLFALTRAIVLAPHPDAHWRLDAQGRLELTGSADPALRPHVGTVLLGASAGGASVSLADARALRRSPRWVIDDAERARQLELHDRVAAVLAQDRVRLSFADGRTAEVRTHPRGLAALPVQFWVLVLFALALYLGASVVLLSQPSSRHLAYALMALFQCGNLLLIAVESTLDFGLPPLLARAELPLRAAFDLFTAATMVNAACRHPRRLPGALGIALAGWLVALGLAGGIAAGAVALAWWWIQSTVFGLGLTAIALLSWSYRIEPHPFAFMLRRFGIVTIATWALLSVALAAADRLPGVPYDVADTGSLIWYLFLGSLLLLVPFLAKSQSFMREFSLLAAISTVATSLDLLFVSVFALGQFASLTLSLFVSLAVYSGVRQWVLSQLLGSSMLTTERMFEQLYRIAHQVEAQPERTPALLSQLLGDLFEPLEVDVVERRSERTHVAGDGSGMLVPVPALAGEGAAAAALLIRFAQRGRRLFTSEDARLADRVVEQLRRAVRFDQAVEQGRSEERMRLAQDLHDDIGARLLTLMYKAQSPEMEDYLRHTLQDLKTLTRGLAASNHRLSHAVAEWKADLSHRLTAAHVELQWTFVFDDDIALTVVHWSALTRILRELVSNVISHSRAQRLDIDFRLEAGRLELTITDDGVGMNPRAWSHGLGLGGVRKRVKQLGGSVEWREIAPHGISCRVIVRDVSRWR